MKYIGYVFVIFLSLSSCYLTSSNIGGNSFGGLLNESNYFGSLVLSDAKQYFGIVSAQTGTDIFDQKNGVPIHGNNAIAFRIPALLTIPNYVIATSDMRYGAPSDSAHNIDSVMRRSPTSGNSWERMKIIQQFDDFLPTNITESRGGNFSSVAESASFIDPSVLYTKNKLLITLTTTFPWNSGLMALNKGRGIQPLESYFKSGNDIYMKLRYGIISDANGGNTWRRGDNNDREYQYAVKVSSFSGSGRNPILKRDLTGAEGDQAGFCIDKYYNLYKNGIRVKSDQYSTGRPDNTKVKVSPLNKINVHLFYTQSYFHPVPTSYVFKAVSPDFGNTWTQPTDITWQFDNSPDQTLYPAKNKNDLSKVSFLGVSPGVGYTIKEGINEGRLLVALQKSPTDIGSGCSAFSIYSDDNGETWHSGFTVPQHPSGGRRSESQYLEAPDNQILLVHRTGNNLAYSTSKDGGISWVKITEPVDASGNKIKNTGADNFGAMVGASNLRQVHFYKNPMFAISLPVSSGRKSGKIYIGYLKKDVMTGDWDMNFNINGKTEIIAFNPNNENETAAYSSVAELVDGSLGLLYEGAGYGGGATGGSTISFAKYAIFVE